MITPLTGFVGIAVGALVPAGMLGASLYSFKEGALVRRQNEEYTWAEQWQILCIAAVCISCFAYFTELLWHKSGVFSALRWEVAAALTILTAWSDYKSKLIPNPMIIVAISASIVISVCEVIFGFKSWQACLATAGFGVLVCGGVMVLSRILTRGGVGFGDVKLFIALGLLLTLRGCINVLVYSMLSAFVVSVTMLILRKKTIHDDLPLAPFVFIGVVVSILFGA